MKILALRKGQKNIQEVLSQFLSLVIRQIYLCLWQQRLGYCLTPAEKRLWNYNLTSSQVLNVT